jgi:prepilin-type N-terminal cleavage/methylation domain-containing protein
MQRPHAKLDNQSGFTLIELMIVVAIIAILAGILIPNFVNARAQAQTSACESNLRSIATAMELMYADLQTYSLPVGSGAQAADPASFGGANNPYLNNTPHDPAGTPMSTYTITPQTLNNEPGYVIACPGAHVGSTLVKIQGCTTATTCTKLNYTSGVGLSGS